MEDRCVICNEIVPEGRQVCLICEYNITEGKNDVGIFERTKDKISEKE